MIVLVLFDPSSFPATPSMLEPERRHVRMLALADPSSCSPSHCIPTRVSLKHPLAGIALETDRPRGKRTNYHCHWSRRAARVCRPENRDTQAMIKLPSDRPGALSADCASSATTPASASAFVGSRSPFDYLRTAEGARAGVLQIMPTGCTCETSYLRAARPLPPPTPPISRTRGSSKHPPPPLLGCMCALRSRRSTRLWVHRCVHRHRAPSEYVLT